MSFHFTRRMFLKCAALAAAAVMSVGILAGCSSDGYDATIKGAGKAQVIQVVAAMGTLEENSTTYTAPDLTGTTVTFPLEITNGGDNPIHITEDQFEVTVNHSTTDSDGKTSTVTTIYNYKNNLTVDPALTRLALKTNQSISGTITVNLKESLSSGDTITLTYAPRVEKYTEYSMSWVLTKE